MCCKPQIFSHLHNGAAPSLSPPGPPGIGGPRRSLMAPPGGVNVSSEAFRRLATVQRGAVERRRDVSRLIARQDTGEFGSEGPETILVEWFTPSPKLACKVGVVFVPLADVGGTIAESSDVWQLHPLVWVKDAQRYVPGQPVFRDPTDVSTAQNRPIPDAYEADTTIERIRGTITLFGSTGGEHVRGSWYAVASWEPRVPMADDERAELFALCDIVAPSKPKDIQAGA